MLNPAKLLFRTEDNKNRDIATSFTERKRVKINIEQSGTNETGNRDRMDQVPKNKYATKAGSFRTRTLSGPEGVERLNQ